MAEEQGWVTSKKIVQSFKAKADAKRSISEKIADLLTVRFGSISFLLINVVWFSFWIAINTRILPIMEPFDPFPFGLLTMIVSLEAIFLAIIVLISQNRASKIDDIREEIDLKIDIITEQELTKLLQLMIKLMEKNGFNLADDKKLKQMAHSTNMEKIENSMEKEIN